MVGETSPDGRGMIARPEINPSYYVCVHNIWGGSYEPLDRQNRQKGSNVNVHCHIFILRPTELGFEWPTGDADWKSLGMKRFEPNKEFASKFFRWGFLRLSSHLVDKICKDSIMRELFPWSFHE